jgi:hypothetical protein
MKAEKRMRDYGLRSVPFVSASHELSVILCDERLSTLPNNTVVEKVQDSSRKCIFLKTPGSLIPRTAQETFGDRARVQLEGQNAEFIGWRNGELDVHWFYVRTSQLQATF